MFLALLTGYVTFQSGAEDDRRRDAMAATVKLTADLVFAVLDSHANDVRVLAALMPVRVFAAGDEAARAGVVRIFSTFIEQKESIAQIRYVDASGQERVRVEGAEGLVTVTPAGALEDRWDRADFREAIALPTSELYLSPLDLADTRGGGGWTPTLRLGRTVAGADGRILGVVMVSIRAAEMLALVDAASRDSGETIQWLNGEGYWLAGAPPDRLWGFMFGRDTTMAKLRPVDWAALTAPRGAGVVRSGAALWAFRTVSPSAALSGRDTGPAQDWKFAAEMPVRGFLHLWTRPRLIFAAAGLTLIGLTCVGWSQSLAARHRAETREKAAERELVEFERLASLGGLVAGVAHELNTPVGNAVTVASTISERVKGFRAEVAAGALRRASLDGFLDDLDTGAALMLRGLDRTARLVQQFKQVAVDQTSQQRRTFILAELVRDIAATLGPQFKHSAARLVVEAASAARLDSYPGPLGQVVINLVGNARVHAFAEGEAGTIRVIVRDAGADAMELRVVDDGHGMPDEVRQRAFEPFFTTRLGEGGSGLGLSIVHNIVTGILGGSIAVESAPGRGTAVSVRMPRVAPSEPETGRIYDVRP